MTAKVAPFGTWDSPVSAVVAAAGAVRVGGLALDGGDIYWVEGRPAESGRNVIVRRRSDGDVEDVTPAGFNVRTRAHEYGGGTFTVHRGEVFFTNDADQRVWRQAPGGAPAPLTPAGLVRYADLTMDPRHGRLLCIREDHRGPGEPQSALVAVPLAGGEAAVLASGYDFYAAPRPSPDGRFLAFLCWNHPQMPWQASELRVAEVEPDGRLGATVLVAGSSDPQESVVQPVWSPDGALLFVSDRSGHWNLYRWREGRTEALCPQAVEFGVAPWVFGLSTYAVAAADQLTCAFQSGGSWHLARLALSSGVLTRVETSFTEIAHVHAAEGQVVFVGGAPHEPWALARLAAEGVSVLRRLIALPVAPEFLSRPEAISFETAGGETAHGLYYPPRHPEVVGPAGEAPPLVVMSHGGPTSATSTALNLPLQFWTSRGFAVFDVNYRGSTGYGRAYRRALDGRWGVADVEDVVAGARALVARGLADERRLVIRGGSAGGYTTLAALTFHDVFRAGASYYGISDLEAMARDTHKFESRYLESLIGPYPARRDLYLARSPLFHTERLSCPVIFFQGLEDKVVPADQAERMVEALQKKGIPVEYVTFPDEQHGFRRAENVARALEAELAFYRRVLGLVRRT